MTKIEIEKIEASDRFWCEADIPTRLEIAADKGAMLRIEAEEPHPSGTFDLYRASDNTAFLVVSTVSAWFRWTKTRETP